MPVKRLIKQLNMESSFNYIQASLNIPKKVAKECSRSGSNDLSVDYYTKLPQYKRQLDKIDKEQLVKELLEYGAWDDNELSNHSDNLQRIFWIACGNICEL